MRFRLRTIYRLLYYGILTAFGVCLFIIGSRGFIKDVIAPHVKVFVDKYAEFLLFIAWFIFMLASFALIFVVWWVRWADQHMKSRVKQYVRKLIAPDYYRGHKETDFYQAIKTSLSKFSRDDAEEGKGSQYDTKGGAPTRKVQVNRPGEPQKPPDANAMHEDEKQKRDGTYKTYYLNGKLKEEVTYLDGKMDGAFRLYYEDGTVHQEKHYKNGKLHGIFKAYDEYGILYFEINYKEGKKHGLEKGYHKNGSLEYQETYFEGKKLNRKTFDEGGDLKSDYNFHGN